MMVVGVPVEVSARLREVAIHANISYSELIARALEFGAGSAVSWARGQALARRIAATRTAQEHL